VKRGQTIAVVAALAVLVVAIVAIRGSRRHPIEYRTTVVDRGDIVATVSATGTIKPVVQVAVGSQVSGTIARLFADYNSPVRAGQVIALLDDSLLRAQLQQATANVSRAEVALEDAQRTLRRTEDLAAHDLVPAAERDAARATMRQREAELMQLRAARDLALVNLRHAVIRAPITGVVVSRSVDVGQTVAASLQAPTLFTIAQDLRHMQVEASIDEADIGTLHPGQDANFTVDAFPDLTFHGKVEQVRVEPITVQNVVTYTAVIRAENPSLLLKPGMTANVWITTARRANVLRVPNAALRFRPLGTGGAAGGRSGERAQAGGGPFAAGTGGASAGQRAGLSGGDQKRVWMRGGGGSAGGGRGASSGDGAGRWPERAPRGAGRDSAAGGVQAQEIISVHPGTVYTKEADGRLDGLRILTGLTDGTYTEIVRGPVREGTEVVLGIKAEAKAPAPTSPLMQGPMPPPSRRGGR
jgi:HlyD family secretion protein